MSFLKKIIDHIEYKKFIRDQDRKREEERVERDRERVLHASEQIRILEKKLSELHEDSSNVSLAEYEKIKSELREHEHIFDTYGFDFGVGKKYQEYAKNHITSPKYDLLPPLIIKKPPFKE